MIKIGLLPLYISLYDESWPYLRPRMEAFYEDTVKKFQAQGLEVISAPFCRISSEFESAIDGFEQSGAQCIVTLHMAYSPSLESSEFLSKTKLPIVVLDITECYDFDHLQDPEELMYCHGIHGVMDMCNLLLRNGKQFSIVAGHPDHSDVIKRACGFISAAISAYSLSGSRTGRIGGSFLGMGDFAVTDSELHERFGVTVVEPKRDELSYLIQSVAKKEIEKEIVHDINSYQTGEKISSSIHEVTAQNSLAVRKWIENSKLDAFSINFLEVGNETGLTTMPFMEICKSMARGIGYAGEGDVLTASFVGALLKGFPKTSFVEIFCPDWKGNTLFLSHMGEMNIGLCANKPEMGVKPFAFGVETDPVISTGCFESGEAVFLNIFRVEQDFKLLLASVTMEAPEYQNDRFKHTVRGWMRPKIDIALFLEKLSLEGATHHSILVYDAQIEQLSYFGKLLGMDVIIL